MEANTGMTSLFASLAPDRQAAVLSYDGPEDFGDPSFSRVDVVDDVPRASDAMEEKVERLMRLFFGEGVRYES